MDFGKVFAFIDAMNREGVEYVTFGGVALNVHGVIRATTDADFFIRPDRENIERLKRALRSVWNDPHIDEISADDLLGDYPSVMYGPPDETFSFDFLTRLGEMYSYENLPSEVVEYEGIPIRVVTAAKLYEMKRNTVRPQDRADAGSLKAKFGFEED
ncbi:MAG TPA: hypothetical protein VF824_10330 [Thermoanaerobaculia bacterium]|jgi:hypothetical protein